MASFTDAITQFNPYVAQLPVEAMVKVGMEKQRRYDEGIQKIQTNIDNIAGLDIMKDVHKNYLQERLNGLGKNLRLYAAADFSDSQLVNSVGGMTNQIVRDPIIQNAVASTARIRKEYTNMETARKEGKSGPSNEWWFGNGVNSFLSDRDLNTSYNGSFINYTDYDKMLRDAIHEAHADSLAQDENVVNADGSINHDILNHKLKEGLSTSKVMNIARSVYGRPEVKQQMMMDGLYKYKDYTPQQLVDEKKASLDYQKEVIYAQDPALRAYSALGDSQRQALANKQLEYNYQQITSLDKEFYDFRNSVIDNFDGAKVNSFVQDKLFESAKNYSWTKIESALKVNPQFTVNMEKSNLALRQAEFRERQYMDSWQIKNIQSEISKRQQDMAIAQLKLEGKVDETGKLVWQVGPTENLQTGNLEEGKKNFDNYLSGLGNQRDQLFRNITAHIPISYNGKTITDLYIPDPNNSGALKVNPKYINTTTGTWTNEGLGIYNAAVNQLKNNIDAAGNLHLTGGVAKAYANDIKRWWDLSTVYDKAEAAGKEIAKKFPGVEPDNFFEYDDAFGRHHKENLSEPKGSDNTFFDPFNLVSKGWNWLTGGTDAEQNREQQVKEMNTAYNNILRGVATNTVQFNPADGKLNNQMRLSLLGELEAMRGEGKGGGWLDDAVNILSKPGTGTDGLMSNNVYKFKNDPSSGKWYLSLSQGQDGTFKEVGHDIEVSDGFVQKYNLNGQLNPREVQFNSSPAGQILNLYQGNTTYSGTTLDATSPTATVTALDRTNVGNYSVGWHAIAKDQAKEQYIPYLYFYDKNTGTNYPPVPLDWSKLANLPGLDKTTRNILKNTDIPVNRVDMNDAFSQFVNQIKSLPNPDAAIKLMLKDQINQ